jgi:hypothetical protein
MSVLQLPLFADLQQKEGELVPSTISCPSIIILENTLVYIKKYGYGNFNHWYVSPIHLRALLGAANFKKVVDVCADRL